MYWTVLEEAWGEDSYQRNGAAVRRIFVLEELLVLKFVVMEEQHGKVNLAKESRQRRKEPI